MRTTIELTPSQHESLTALARRRGMRGFSAIVQEALDAYLAEVGADEVEALLALEGSISESEADEVLRRIEEAREVWRVA